ncbi:MAG: FAD-binding protein, partial [Pseudomonadales bacterium]
TCGGMGLTGIIINATIRLIPVRSRNVIETTFKAPNLDLAIRAFDENADAPYSMAWIDCLSRRSRLGRSLITIGQHAEDDKLEGRSGQGVPVPFDMPSKLLNSFSIRAFNSFYYARKIKDTHTRVVPFGSFFYPLDAIRNWNRLYGRQGFVQYQLVTPKDAGLEPLRVIVARIAESGLGSFLAVLKTFGPANENPLSFPIEGYTLALDFKAHAESFRILDELDAVVLDHGGRLYLTKDSRMTEAVFKRSYPTWIEFEEIRARYHAIGRFSSDQSKRLGLE